MLPYAWPMGHGVRCFVKRWESLLLKGEQAFLLFFLLLIVWSSLRMARAPAIMLNQENRDHSPLDERSLMVMKLPTDPAILSSFLPDLLF